MIKQQKTVKDKIKDNQHEKINILFHLSFFIRDVYEPRFTFSFFLCLYSIASENRINMNQRLWILLQVTPLSLLGFDRKY